MGASRLRVNLRTVHIKYSLRIIYTIILKTWDPKCTGNTVQHTKCYGNETGYTLLIWGRWIRKWHRNFQLSYTFRVTVMSWNYSFLQLNIRSPSSKVGNTVSWRHNYTTMKSRDRLSSLQVVVTWSVELLPVNSLHFLLSVVRKRSYCRWCSFMRIVSW